MLLRVVCGIGLLASWMAAHAERDFTGTTPSGAYYRIAVPDSWQPGDTLVLFQHGLTFDPPAPNPDLGPLVDLQLAEGYAVAASSYSQRSWALFTAAQDNAELLAAFRQQVGAPGAIIPYGGSLGGLIALKLAEDPRFAPVPGVYAACAPAAGARVWDTAIDLRLAFDVVCAGAGAENLPQGAAPYPWAFDLDDIPDNLSDLEDEARLLQTLVPVNQCTGVSLPPELRNGAMQRRLAQLMDLAHITSEKFFVTNTAYATYALSDLVRAPDKLGGASPFSTVGVVYGDAAIDAGIARISADPFASLYFHDVSDFRGDIALTTKVLSVHTSRDELVIPANEQVLQQTLPANQLTVGLVNEAAPTHCGFTEAEGVGGWEALRRWIAGGPQPQVADLQVSCNAAAAQGADGDCRYDASLTVPTFDSQVRPRATSSAPAVDARYSGQWFDPARNGEGIALEVLDDGHALVYMFTYPPPGAPGQQAWLIGVGDVIGNGIEFTDVQRGSLAPGGTLQSAHWGRIGLVFDDCSTGRMRWDGPAEWGSLEVPITRLTAFSGLDCASSGNAAPAQISGSWSDPRYNGNGFVFEQLDAQHAAAIWFGFDAQGNQVWLSGVLQQGVGGYAGIFYQPHGPRFGAGYDPAAFDPVQQGSISLLTAGCATASGTVLGIPGITGDVSPLLLSLARFTFPAGVPRCP
jgi:hypothetical protein